MWLAGGLWLAAVGVQTALNGGLRSSEALDVLVTCQSTRSALWADAELAIGRLQYLDLPGKPNSAKPRHWRRRPFARSGSKRKFV